MLCSNEVIKNSGISFGTSGARGLSKDFTKDVCAAFTYAFVRNMEELFSFKRVAVAIDNRPSSTEMAKACIKTLERLGIEVDYYGVIPTPALAYVSMKDCIPSIMVTGSHIPFDRNGLKFYKPDGEINKVDEQSILDVNVQFSSLSDLPELKISSRAAIEYVERYTGLFRPDALAGKRIGIYEHSSAGRDLYADIFIALGAEVLSLDRKNEFVPIDTESVSDSDKLKALHWSKLYNLDAIFSTDGDGDRPLIADENGEWLRGDILGLLCSKFLGADAVVIPVNCNTAIDSCSLFSHVVRTKIGSPYVIAEFNRLNKSYQTVAGFEANGGYLLGSDVMINDHLLKALPTRDAVLPALMLFAAAKDEGIAHLVKGIASRVTHSDRIQDFSMERSLFIIKQGIEEPKRLLDKLGFSDKSIINIDITDGLRLTLSEKIVIHLRPSGNSPELRCYAEADSTVKAQEIVKQVLNKVQLI